VIKIAGEVPSSIGRPTGGPSEVRPIFSGATCAPVRRPRLAVGTHDVRRARERRIAGIPDRSWHTRL